MQLRCDSIPHERIKIVSHNLGNENDGDILIFEVWVDDELICSCFGPRAACSAAIIAKEFEQGTVPNPTAFLRWSGPRKQMA